MNESTIREYLHILGRRKWILLLALVIVPLAAVAVSLRHKPLYEASADVLLRYQSLPSTLSGISDPSSFAYYINPSRTTSTQLEIATLPALAQRVAAAMPRDHLTTGSVLGAIGVSDLPNTDVLRFSARTRSPGLAARLATEYAREYTFYRQQLDTASVTKALSDLSARIVTLRSEGARSQVRALLSKVDQLQTLLSLETSNAVLVRTASGAAKVEPRPRRALLIGIGLGFVLGIGLALLREALDTRLRTSDQIAAVLELPLLGRIPAPPRQFQRDRRLVMVDDPTSVRAEAFRQLRMNIEFVSVNRAAKVIMVTSALGEEGKSTTAANLAVAAARSGKRVVLADLDLRRPTIEAFFRVPKSAPGLTGVIVGHASLSEAVLPVPLEGPSPRTDAKANGGGAVGTELFILPAGILPPDPGEFVALPAVADIVAELRSHFDLVIVDAPPILPVGDALTIGGLVDATLLIIRAERARRSTTAELARTAARLPSRPLGFALVGGELEADSYYGYGYSASSRRRESRSTLERVS